MLKIGDLIVFCEAAACNNYSQAARKLGISQPAALKRWIPGVTLRDSEQSDFRALGKAIARLHQIPTPQFLPKVHPYGLKQMSGTLGLRVDLPYESWLSDKIDYLGRNLNTELPKAFIHGDLFDDNVLYHQERFKAIIDFEDACYYYRAYDIGSAFFGTCITDETLDFDKASCLVEGYQEISILEEVDMASIQFFTVYAGAAISAWRYRTYNFRKPNPEKRNRHLQAVRRTDHVRQIPERRFRENLKV